MKRKVLLFIFVFVFGASAYLAYFAIDFNQYFLNNDFETRKTKCKYFNRNELKNKLQEYRFSEKDLYQLGIGDYSFESLLMRNDTSNNFLILIHGKRECPYAMIRGGYQLYTMGYSVLVPVLYAHGNDSVNNYIDYGRFSIEQVNECVEFAYKNGAHKIGLIGRSMGASIAIITAAKNPKIDAVVSECPLKSVESSIEYKHQLYSDFPQFPFLNIKNMITEWQIGIDLDRLACINYVDQISPRPLFLMAATKDMVVNPNDFEEIYQKAEEPKIIWREEINHTKFHSTLKDEFYQRVDLFFQESFQEN